MKANMREGLSLRLVNSHGISQLQKKLLANVNGKSLLSEMNLMRGIKATLLAPLPVMISASTIRIVKHQIISVSHCTAQLMG
jgi:hypothetical protein